MSPSVGGEARIISVSTDATGDLGEAGVLAGVSVSETSCITSGRDESCDSRPVDISGFECA